MSFVGFRNPGADPRRCSRRPLIASVGPLRPWPVEVGKHAGGSPLECEAEPADLFQGGGHAAADGLDHRAHLLATIPRSGSR